MVPLSRSGRYATGMSERQRIIERAAASYRALAELAEAIEDEWQYVTDLVEAYEPAILALGDGGGERPLGPGQVAAVDEAIAEIELIADPHKAIDWLSTFPHVLALALGGDVDQSEGGGSGSGDDPAGPDEDSPFRALLGGNR
jgi:hypothetical protein